MAVTGRIGDSNVVLDNAAEEATLERLVRAVENIRPPKTGVNSTAATNKNIRSLGESSGQAGKSIDGLLRQAVRGHDNLQDLADASDKAGYSLANAAKNIGSSIQSNDPKQIIQNVGDTMAGAAEALGSNFGIKGKLIGQAAGKLIEGVTGVSAFAVGAIDQFTKNFQEMAAVGLVTGQGIGAFNDKILASGSTLGQFVDLVKNNSSDLRTLGGSASQGAIAFLKLRRQLVNNEEQLLRMGYSYDEMNSLLAEYAGDIRVGFVRNRLSDKQIADQTAEYAKNLRIVSDITGQNAQTLREQSRQLQTERLNQYYIMGLMEQQGEGVKKAYGDVSATISETMGQDALKLFQEYNTPMGVAMNETTKQFEANAPLQAEALRQLRDDLAAGRINSAEALRDTLTRIKALADDPGVYAEIKDIARLSMYGAMGATGLENFGTDIGVVSDKMGQLSKADIAAVQKNIEDSLKTQDSITTASIKVQTSMQEIQTALNLATDGLVKMIAGPVTSSLNYFANTVKQIGIDMRVAEEGPGYLEKAGSAFLDLNTMIPRFAMKQVEDYNLFGYKQGDLLAEEYRESITPFYDDWIRKKEQSMGLELRSPRPEFATGGIVPDFGPQGRAVTVGDGVSEAIVPLPNGRSIPVNLSDASVFNSMASKLDSLINVNRAMLNAMEQGNSINRTTAMYAR